MDYNLANQIDKTKNNKNNKQKTIHTHDGSEFFFNYTLITNRDLCIASFPSQSKCEIKFAGMMMGFDCVFLIEHKRNLCVSGAIYM